jgi:hypothetical protein
MKKRKVLLLAGSISLLVVIVVAFGISRTYANPNTNISANNSHKAITSTSSQGPATTTTTKDQSSNSSSLVIPHQTVGVNSTPIPTATPTQPAATQTQNQPQAQMPTSSTPSTDRYFPVGTSVATMQAEAANMTKQQVKTLIEQQVNANWGVIQAKLGFANQSMGYAFFLGMATRESTLAAALETGSGASHSYGPLQAAETAYANANSNYSPETDVPQMVQYDFTPENFYDPGIAVHMGIRHLLHFANQAQAAGYTGADLLRHALIGYNTGYVNNASASWLQQYSDEIGALAGWYLNNGHLYDNEFTYTGDTRVDRSNPWSWY